MSNPTHTHSLYLVCKEYTEEVRAFLSQFYTETTGPYNYEHWVSFEIPGGFSINLMEGEDQPITQNVTLQIDPGSLEHLHELGTRYNQPVQNFLCDETDTPYQYYYIEVLGPHGICKIEFSHSEKL
jgi:hypothetical protein